MALALLSVVYSALRAGSNTALFNLGQSVGAADEVCGHALRRWLLPELPLMSVLWGLWWMCGNCSLGGGPHEFLQCPEAACMGCSFTESSCSSYQCMKHVLSSSRVLAWQPLCA